MARIDTEKNTAADAKLQATYRNQAEMLANRVKKRYRQLYRRFAKQKIEAFRLYDWDIPEIRAAVDWYAGHVVIAEYTRTQSTAKWLPIMGEAIAAALNVSAQHVHLKQRRAGYRNGCRYRRLARTEQKIVVAERDLLFHVNPYDYIDTGLFADHRNTRQMIREMAEGNDFLNLFCYTATFSCYAIKGGARRTVSVDRSESAIRWARENMKLNGIAGHGHSLIQSHAFDFLKNAKRRNQAFDLAWVDPPSFSKTRANRHDFDIVRDHVSLLAAVMELMRKGATIFFSTNHQRFEPRLEELPASRIAEITSLTIPEDYVSSKKKIHRCWQITV
jgi:23S rRNA G2069 N7-methylase RlmK/C1962 C5-methylase RlmI